ncbi:hypothetical protein BDW69DRAFT_197895 [Aspergillus filifer]
MDPDYGTRLKESALFLVTIENLQYALKVHHGRGPKLLNESRDSNTNPHSRKVTAYKRLQAHGLCSRGLVPEFNHSIEDLNPNDYAPHLWMFEKDEYPPKEQVDPSRERAMWIDFDNAQTYDSDPDKIMERQREYMDFDMELIKEIAELAKAHAEEREFNKSAHLYN